MGKYGANKGSLSKDGVFTPGGQYGVPGGQAVGRARSSSSRGRSATGS